MKNSPYYQPATSSARQDAAQLAVRCASRAGTGSCDASITYQRTELVTTLKRHATEILSELERDKEPILITQHGVPSAYLVDVETYETLQRRMSLLEGIARGERAIEEGRTLSHAQAKQRMARWLR